MRAALVLTLLALVAAGAEGAPRDRFEGEHALVWVERQVKLGPRPAGSPASRRLGEMLRRAVPRGRFQRVPGGLRNVIGTVPGRDPKRLVVVGAHYDTYELDGFVGANDGASGTAVVVRLSRTLQPRKIRPNVVFVLFDGEESPPGKDFTTHGMRGSRVAARAFRHAEAMVLLDMVGDRNLSIPRERGSNRALWTKLRAAAADAGAARHFPRRTVPRILDDHVPFARAGVPAVDLIDFEFPCWHRRCDNLSAVSARSLDAVGETVLRLLERL